MFGSKDRQQPETTADQRFEFMTQSFVGDSAFNKGVNLLAKSGWEVINASFNGMAHHVYLRREINPKA